MLTVNSNCVKCGICAQVCPIGIVEMRQDGPILTDAKACVRCGHCVAVCPKAALDHAKVPYSNQVPLDRLPVLNPETAEQFLRSRRSIRCYRQEPVPRELLLKLIDIGRFAPTAGNTQGVSYIVVTQKEIMNRLTEIIIDWMEQQLQAGVKWIKPYEAVVQNYRTTKRDVILRGAPHLIVGVAAKEFGYGRDNTRYSLTYAELFAPALGLGTCWAGFFEVCASSGHPEIYKLLEVEAGKTITGAIMVGYPQYSYQRLVDRNPLQVTWR